jgi:hypothetical protein
MYQVVSEAPLSVLAYDSENINQDSEEEEDEQVVGQEAIENKEGEIGDMDIKQLSFSVSKPYYGKQGKQEYKKSSVYQPKPKRHQVSIIDEPEYQEDFGKNLKKVIENNLNEQTPILEEEVIDVESVDIPKPTVNESIVIKISISDNDLINKDTDVEEKKEEKKENPTKHGSSDCALIPKRDDERSQYFRFFS